MKHAAAVLFAAVVILTACSPKTQVDQPKAQKITCVNNLKMVGIALRLWAGDHNWQYPFNVSTNDGGTREFCVVGPDGFAPDATLHFGVLTNADELKTPLLLICPQDHSKKPAHNFNELKLENITYRLRVGTNISVNGERSVLVVCPIDGNMLYPDGKVVQTKESGDGGIKPMDVR